MRKRVYITMMVTILMLTFISCSKDNEIQNQDTIRVNIAALYDELGIRDEMTQALASGNYLLTDTLLVYDASGSLVKKLGSESHSLEPLTFNVKGLANGSYTLVLWQTARSASGNRSWKLFGEDQLSTAILGETSAPLSYAFSAGYALATVAAKGGKLVQTLTPMAIGSIVDMRVNNLTAMHDATALSLWGTHSGYYTGIRLAPNLNADARWYTAPDTTFLGRIAQLPVGQASGMFFTLYHGNIPLELWADKGDDEEYVTDISHSSLPVGGQSICYFDMGRHSWQPPFLGTPNSFVSWKADRDANIPVTDPLLQWGCSFKDVQNYVFGKMWYWPGNDKLEYWEDTFESWHGWWWVSKSLTEQYLFETEDGQNLRYVVCYCWDKTVPGQTRDNLLQHQGFQATGNTVKLGSQNLNQYLSADGATEALTSFFDGGYWIIVYRPVN